ncbi:MAG TPA: glycoside hydrolase family 3 N-terminal domain-containing protein, partial [Saccharofermentans sp.]|nr:glycoside hydrolase family 3 N-terminal domain-containing protein [Saccharofermentans sp.]
MAIPDMTQLIQLLGLEVIHMTNEEKCNFVCGATSFGTYENPDLGIRRLRLIDGGTGVNFEQLLEELRLIGDVDMSEFSGIELDHVAHFFYDEKKLSENEKILQKRIEKYYENLFETKNPSPGCYPPGILLASTWNRDLIYQVGQALGLEAAKYEIDVLLGTPNVNLLRDPRCGRFFEGYSEDPYLAGKLASGLISGVQSKGIAANVKHFAANNLEINRINIDETISKRALYEMYFPQFKD